MKKLLFITLVVFSFNMISVNAEEIDPSTSVANDEVKILMVDEDGNGIPGAVEDELKREEVKDEEVIYSTTGAPDEVTITQYIEGEVKDGDEITTTSIDTNTGDEKAEFSTTSVKEEDNLLYYAGGGAVVIAALGGLYILKKKKTV